MACYDRVLSRLQRLRWHQSSRLWSACCPNKAAHKHGDRNPSLLLWVGRNGNLMARCKGCGADWSVVCAELGTDKNEWFAEEARMEEVKSKCVATYRYIDAQGKLAYVCKRWEPGRNGRKKDFGYSRPQPDGGWVNNLEGVTKITYRLPELLDPSRKAHPVFIVEGEGKVEVLMKLGFLATSSPCGAGQWQRDYGRYLTDRRVVILPDNDEPGWNHAVGVVGSLFVWNAAEVRVVHLPGLPDGGDVKDWLHALPAGTTPASAKAKLIELVKAAPKWERK